MYSLDVLRFLLEPVCCSMSSSNGCFLTCILLEKANLSYSGRKVMTNLDSILQSKDITLPTKVHLVKAMVFQWSCMNVRVGL